MFNGGWGSQRRDCATSEAYYREDSAMDLVSGSSTRFGRAGNIRPHLCTLLRNNSESDLIIVEADPSDLAEGGEGCRELCGRDQLMTRC